MLTLNSVSNMDVLNYSDYPKVRTTMHTTHIATMVAIVMLTILALPDFPLFRTVDQY